MSKGVSARVSDIIAKEGESRLHGLMADLIRVLAIYRGVSWRSELIYDLLKFYRFLNRSETISLGLLDEALNQLKAEGLINIEERVRGFLMRPGTYLDKFIQINDLGAVMRVLAVDQIFVSYVHAREKKIRERVGKGRTREEV